MESTKLAGFLEGIKYAKCILKRLKNQRKDKVQRTRYKYVLCFLSFVLCSLYLSFILYDVCAECEGFFHVACGFDDIELGREVVEMVDEDSLSRGRNDRRTIFEFTMMGKDNMNDAVGFFCWHIVLEKFRLESVGRDEDMPKKIHVLLWFSLLIIFIHLTVVVEEDGENATLEFHIVVRQDGIDAFKHVQHLIGVVQKSTLESVMNRCGCGIEGIRFEKYVSKLCDERLERFIFAKAEQMVDAFVPKSTLDGARHKVVERMSLLWHHAWMHVEFASRLFVAIVLNSKEGNGLSYIGFVGRLHIPHGYLEFFF